MYSFYTLLSLLIIQSIQCFLVPDSLVSIQAPAGKIVGYRTTLRIKITLRIKGTHRGLRKFLGIPYAESPIGINRFQKPIPKARF